ncbi:ovochymase-2 [Clupea harengus]|uniref:Ovochymase-2 n=1 Tax=Clupea harengus TaxID=7950 RepID=A0A6P8EUT6_CLUHA|nr:ovochymase-2 [Clupea harengus]
MKESPPKKGCTGLEKGLILLFLAVTGVCIGLVVVYFQEVNSTDENGGVVDVVNSGCGGPQQLMMSSGEFTSGNFPGNYDSGKSCSWHITVEANKVIHLWFQEFSLEDTDTCWADFVTLKDDLGIIGKYCGHSKPKPIVTLGNSLWVYLDTNEVNPDKGFRAMYKTVAPEAVTEIVGAGGLLQGDQGELSSPGFPAQQYESGALYQWKIKVQEGERVRLTFTSFQLVVESCLDYVDVYDGYLPSADRLARFCGASNPTPVVSSSDTMVVRFKTDASQSAGGFQAVYTLASDPPIGPNPLESGCGDVGTLSGRKGVIQSKGFPEPYPAGLSCRWNITVADDLMVKLHITDLAITGEAGQCKEDRLLITDAQQSFGPHCGFITPAVVVSVGNTMSVTFQSDSFLADRGFSARWEAVYPHDIGEAPGCGSAYHAETGVIKSQNWPMNYAPNKECMWRVKVPTGKRITLRFTDFGLEPAMLGKCYDNLVVYDGSGPKAKKYGPFCGSTLPKEIKTTGNTVVVRLHADFFTEAKGFRAYWTTDTNLPAPTEPPVQPNPWDGIPIGWPETCGKPQNPPLVHTRIVNGEPAKPHSWPWQVSLQVWPDKEPEPKFFHTCGGTLIHKNWVMTAAHCFIRYADELQRWRICMGKHNLTYTEPGELCLGVRGIYRHESFKYPDVPTVEFDVALMRLDGEVTPSAQIDFACLPSVEEQLPGDKKCYASGWGDEKGNPATAKPSEALNQVALPVVPYETCKGMDYWWFQVKPSMICCGYTKPDELKSVCQGDSGGPLVCQDNATTPWEVHGITSFGPIGCIMDKKPSVFTRTSAYIPWMENAIRRNIYELNTSGCGGAKYLNSTRGTMATMNHPDNYDNGAQCQWHIRAPAGKLIHLRFANFSLEESLMCMNDKVTLTDQLGSLGTRCGIGAVPQALVTLGETLNVTFSSNNRIVDTGFMAHYQVVDPSEGEALVGCGGHFNTEQGELKSPNWPSDYPNQAVCTWWVSVPSAKAIHITFTHFDVQAANRLGQCVDYVEIFSSDMKSLGKHCGFVPPPTTTVPGDTAIVRFFTNSETQEKGFRGYWTTNQSVFPTLPPPPPNPWDNINIMWPENCGMPEVSPNTSVTRVVNGIEAIPHSWPWQVSMQATPFAPIPHMHVCGGSLIHEEWVLTAAHCIMAPFNRPGMWRMCLGKHHMNSSWDGSTEQCVPVDTLVSHEAFVYPEDNTDITNDIALVHLAKPVKMTAQVRPVCMPTPDFVLPAGETCFVTGWGDEKGSVIPKVAEKLNQAPLPVVPYSTCSKPQYWWDSLRPSMVCAGYELPDELKSACQGDSGGPFVCRPGGTKAWEVHGIVSFGPFGCIQDKKPSVFTRTSAFSHWVEDNMKRVIYESTSKPSRE